MLSASAHCPLCGSDRVRPFATVQQRGYHDCDVCRLVHLAPTQRLAAAAEHEHYLTHENDPADFGYRAFLSRLAVPLAERLEPGAEGLDYGCGPGPALARMLEEQGFRVSAYDPFFAPDDAALGRRYDFVTCTEVAEHFFEPAAELERLQRLLRPGGWLGVMTELLDEQRDFASWRYVRDPTHVCFYRPPTMRWIADHFGWEAHFVHRNVVLFQKPSQVAT
jgi:2-polyprenyl-3-methyl-5-hydroxy-6-metoxy-1,4-benzoquinol methylase